MKKLSLQDIDHLATLASLPLSDQEAQQFSGQLNQILEHVGNIAKIDSHDLAETAQVTGKVNHFRPDEIKLSLTQAQVLANSNKTYQGYFVVPRLIHHG